MAKHVFRSWDVSQREMFPPTFPELVPAGHSVHFVRRLVVEDLDMSAPRRAPPQERAKPATPWAI